eukprot:COSAG02_NODE_43940_length_370_cov_0.904059_2_plen_55_part_01
MFTSSVVCALQHASHVCQFKGLGGQISSHKVVLHGNGASAAWTSPATPATGSLGH